MKLGLGLSLSHSSLVFNPTRYSGCWLWLPDSSLVVSGGVATGWTDRSALGNVFASSGTQRPAFSASAIANKGGVTFDGTNDVISCASLVQAQNTNSLTMFIVMKPGNKASTYDVISDGGVVELINIGTSGTVVKTVVSSAQKGATCVGVAGTAAVFAFRGSGTASDSYKDGVLIGSGAAVSSAFTALQIGAYNAAGAGASNAVVSAVLGYSRALGASEIGSVSAGLRRMYKTP